MVFSPMESEKAAVAPPCPLSFSGCRSRQALEATWDLVFEVDLHYGVLLTGLGGWRRVLGVRARPDYGQTLAQAARRVHPDDAERFLQAFSPDGLRSVFARGGRPAPMSFQLRSPRGTKRWLVAMACPLADGAGRPVRALGALRRLDG